MQSKRSLKVKRREQRKKKHSKNIAKNKVITPNSPEGLKIQNQFDEAMVDKELQEFQRLLATCKNMITQMYNRIVQVEVAITKLINLLTSKSIFSKSGISNLKAISLLNAEKNKIYVFKNSVIRKLVSEYIRATKCTDRLEAMHKLSDLNTEYTHALNTMQEIFDSTRELNTMLDLEETSECVDDGIINAPTVTQVEEIATILNSQEDKKTDIEESTAQSENDT